jgi:hypothetical protein
LQLTTDHWQLTANTVDKEMVKLYYLVR